MFGVDNLNNSTNTLMENYIIYTEKHFKIINDMILNHKRCFIFENLQENLILSF